MWTRVILFLLCAIFITVQALSSIFPFEDISWRDHPPFSENYEQDRVSSGFGRDNFYLDRRSSPNDGVTINETFTTSVTKYPATITDRSGLVQEDDLDPDYYPDEYEYEEELEEIDVNPGDNEILRENPYTKAQEILATIGDQGHVRDGGGISIHIKDSVLEALLERVPWSSVLEGLNNRLTRSEEVKHIKEHIYKTANEDTLFDHNNWNNNGLLKQNLKQWNKERLRNNHQTGNDYADYDNGDPDPYSSYSNPLKHSGYKYNTIKPESRLNTVQPETNPKTFTTRYPLRNYGNVDFVKQSNNNVNQYQQYPNTYWNSHLQIPAQCHGSYWTYLTYQQRQSCLWLMQEKEKSSSSWLQQQPKWQLTHRNRYRRHRNHFRQRPANPRVYQRSWRSPSGREEYTFRHTIVTRVNNPLGRQPY